MKFHSVHISYENFPKCISRHNINGLFIFWLRKMKLFGQTRVSEFHFIYLSSNNTQIYLVLKALTDDEFIESEIRFWESNILYLFFSKCFVKSSNCLEFFLHQLRLIIFRVFLSNPGTISRRSEQFTVKYRGMISKLWKFSKYLW